MADVKVTGKNTKEENAKAIDEQIRQATGDASTKTVERDGAVYLVRTIGDITVESRIK